MSKANLCRQRETSLCNFYQFSGKLYDECDDNTFDTAENVPSYINDCLGSSNQTTEQKYTYDALYQLIKAEGMCKYSFQKNNNIDRTDTYTQTFQYDTTGNLIRKTTNISDVSRLAWTDLANYDLSYEYNSDYAHRLKKAGSDYYQYDSNGNITAISTTSFDPTYDIQITYIGDDEIHYNWNVVDGTPPIKQRNPSNQRTCLYDDRDQMSEVMDIGVVSHTYYYYDEEKKRTSKKIGTKSEIITFNDFYSISLDSRTRSELGQTQKSIMLGQTRLVSKIDSGTKSSTREWKDEHTFYYLSDHIGTVNFVTTYEGEIFQITEYTPYGERWIERSETKSYAYYLPYRFAGKPLDEETGWYYFGARYYDPKYQIWTTSDPALADYFSDTQKGEGGVFNHINLNTYHYAGNNPVKYVDPDGRSDTNSQKINLRNYVEKIGSNLEFGLSQTSNAAYFTSTALDSIGRFANASKVLSNTSTVLTGVSTFIDSYQFSKESSVSGGIDVVLDVLTFIPVTAPYAIGASFYKMGIEYSAENISEFAVKSEQKIDNYIENQILDYGGPENWEIPANGLFDIIFEDY